MFIIKKATTADIPLINKLAWNVFPETYKNILTHEQIEYMMDWMYSIENLHKQMEEEGHIILPTRNVRRQDMFPSVRRTRICFTSKRFTSFPIIRSTIWASNCSSRLSKASRNFIRLPAAWN